MLFFQNNRNFNKVLVVPVISRKIMYKPRNNNDNTVKIPSFSGKLFSFAISAFSFAKIYFNLTYLIFLIIYFFIFIIAFKKFSLNF